MPRRPWLPVPVSRAGGRVLTLGASRTLFAVLRAGRWWACLITILTLAGPYPVALAANPAASSIGTATVPAGLSEECRALTNERGKLVALVWKEVCRNSLRASGLGHHTSRTCLVRAAAVVPLNHFAGAGHVGQSVRKEQAV